MFIKSIAVSGLVTAATAHILMTNPVPYGLSSLSNGPLAADGSDFPCKQREGVYNAEGANNVYAQGSKQQLEFQGTAVHGGGSCQVSITTDLKPTKNSVWKVIKSIEGGCPAKDQAGNMGNDAKAKVPYKYDFTIPEELAAGDYTLAWTWFNKIGNREMYMNCAPLSVTGNAGSQTFLNGLPDMMVANVGDGCSTPDSSDAKFLDPGKDIDKFNGKTDAFSAPVGACGKTGAHPEPTASGTASVQPTSAQPNPSVPTSGGSAPPSSPPGGIFITSPTPQPTPTPAPSGGNSSVPGQSPSKPPPTSVTTSTPIATGLPPTPTGGPIPGNPPPPSAGHPPGSSCSSEGLWNCIDGKSFQRCASGKWSVPQALSLGMSCQVGESANIKMGGASRIKRAMRRNLRIRH
ncbi:hypothetical protein BB8028_0005g09140 [Beauveria bassiana]|uniref:Chitin-binding type-4 domain-containing protein n=1 Tax=Beauveria bassiana TaxID=176275 RepID=A0A2S7YGU0_BEABA|nr:hypothetical protein BB8028_0005g09140 [Beauveria bassiana]